MNRGKVPEKVLERSVLRTLREVNKDVITGAAFGEDCAILCYEKGEDAGCYEAHAVGVGYGKEEAASAFIKAVNNLSAGGFIFVTAAVSVILPEFSEEEELKEIMKVISDTAKKLSGFVTAGQTEVSPFVTKTVISVTAIGKLMGERILRKKDITIGEAIVAAGFAGNEGASILVRCKNDVLKERFPIGFLSRFKGWEDRISVVSKARIAYDFGVTAMKDVSERGVFSALWELGSASGRGLQVNLKDIPIKQETIEICNFFNINPYGMKSSGMLLMVTKDPDGLTKALSDAGFNASKIGMITADNDRVIVNDDEIRHLDKILQDEIYKII